MLIHSCEPHICGGVIISYSSRVTFYISNHLTVKVGIGNDVYDTGIPTEANKWNLISVVFVRSTLQLSVYITTSTYTQGKTFTVKIDPFSDGGTLAVGLWQPSPGVISVQVSHVFRGIIDELRVWKRALDYAVISQSFKANVQTGISALSGLWKFNEGEGYTTKDLVTSNHLSFPKYPMRPPSWLFSNAPIDYVPVVNPNLNNVTLQLFASRVCSEFILTGPLFETCSRLGNVTLEFYLRACITKVAASGERSQSMATIVALSDYCQVTLKLSFWPARRLCNHYPGMDFPYWIGENCTTPCIYGRAANVSQDICECKKGYYGSNCSGVCPGGPLNTCNKQGSCDSYGVCVCEVNWKGDVNCTSCSGGWRGGDCSVAVTDPIVNRVILGVSAVSVRGHISIFTGYSFVLQITGEYYLIISLELSIHVQVRFVSCFELDSCINALAIRISSHTLVIHGPYTSEGSIVLWLDGTVIDIDIDPPSVNIHGFIFIRVSVGLYKFEHHDLKLYIRVDGRYLNLRVKASEKLCNSSIGLLGSCDEDILDVLETYKPPTNCSEAMHNNTHIIQHPANINNSNVTSAKIKDLSTKVKVLECDSLFVYSYKEYTEHRGANAGYSLFFNGTALVSTTVIYKAFLSNDITIDLMVNIQSNGLIFSYGTERTLYLTSIGGTFSIHYGAHIYRTNITVTLNVWTQLSLVYRRSTGKLQLYYFIANGIVRRVDLDISININLFEAGGHLALFGWFPPLGQNGSPPPIICIGSVDQLRIWTRYFHPALIQQIYKREVLVQTDALAHAWRFNEGEGVVPMDTYGDVNFKLTTTPWLVPAWKFSDAVLKEPFFETQPKYDFKNESLQNESEMFCHRLIITGPLFTACGKLGKGLLTFYYRSCLQRIASSGQLNSSIEVIITLSDYCQTTLSLDIWPAKPLCNEFPGRDFPIWYGPECDHRCENGIKVLPDVCTCHVGYWGSNCTEVCPGGAASPCHKHGQCNVQSGKCLCEINWKGIDCSTCSTGWNGLDCSIAVVSISASLHVSYAVTSYSGQFVTFDGVSYTFVAIGEYNLIYSVEHSLILQIRQVPTDLHTISINAIAFKVFNTLISFHGPYVTGGLPVLWVNGIAWPITGLVTNLGPVNLGIRLRIESRDRYVIAWSDNLIIHIRVDGRYLSFKVDVDKQYCANSTGLLGSCDNNSNNDVGGIPLANTTQGSINTILPDKYRANSSESLFVLQYGIYKELRNPTGGVYALTFNSTGASTGPLLKSIVANVDLTIEILFKPFSHRGTLLSYAYLNTFAIVLDTTVKIYYNQQVINTGIAIQFGYWSHLSFVWQHKTRVIQIYHFDYKGYITRVKYELQDNPFIPAGILTLGQWELSQGDTEERNTVSFVGVIDELRIWHQAFDPVLIQQNARMNVQREDPGLGGLWKFNEGEGDVIHELVNGEDMYLPRSPWSSPLWVYSDADIKTNVTLTSSPYFDKNKTLEKEAKSLCHELFFNSHSQLHISCKTIKAELEFHYRLCVKDIGSTGLLSSSLTAVITFADHCEVVLKLSYWPAQKLCNSIPGAVFPNWIGDNCDIACIFGTASHNDRNLCECSHGYWGDDCSKTCPGGILMTCGNHGYCDRQSGKCICDINWHGNSSCTSCSPRWYGQRCQFAVTVIKRSSRALQIASVGSLGYYKSFSGLCFTLRTSGEFYLLRSTIDNFVIQVRRGFCSGSLYSTTCTVGFAFSYKDVRITFRAPVRSVSKKRIIFPLVWRNGNLIRIDHLTQIDADFVMVRTSTISYTITGPSGISFVITVGQSLGLTFNIPNMYCQNSTGLLGSCTYKNLNDSTAVENAFKDLINNSTVGNERTLFYYVYNGYHEHRHVTGAGFCVRFTDSFVISRTLFIPRVQVITLELLVRVEYYGGVILSFMNMKPFTVINERTLKISYGSQVMNTNISLEILKWNQISLVFYQLTGKLELHCFNHLGVVSVRVFMLDKEVFASGGKLSFGQLLSSSEQTQPPDSVFYGEIDEVKMWGRRTNPEMLKQNQNLNVLPDSYPDLLHLWKINEVERRVIKDSAGNDDLYLKRFHKPERDFSDAEVPTVDTETRPTQNKTLEKKLREFCRDTILEGPLHENCAELDEPLAQSYYNSCLHDTSLYGDIESAIDAVIAYSDYCQEALNLQEWPARKLCNRFKQKRFPNWIGDSCEKRCKFGYPKSTRKGKPTGTCKCERGYWGKDCSNLCDGGLYNVCNNRGSCDKNGKCKCSYKWNGTETYTNTRRSKKPRCSTCTNGWKGRDCSITAPFKSKKSSMTINFGDPHFTTVNGVNYNFEVPGAYQLVTYKLFSVQILQVPCNNKVTCRRIAEIAIKTTPFVLSVKYVNLTEVETKLFDLTPDAKSKSSELESSKSDEYVRLPSTDKIKPKYRWLTADILEFEFTDHERIYILVYNGTLGVAVELSSEQGEGTKGLCGEDTGEWLTSLQVSQKTPNESAIDQNVIDKTLCHSQQVKTNDVILTSAFAKQSITTSGFTMVLGSNYLSHVMQSRFPVLEEFTIEFWVCLVNADSSVINLCSNSKINGTILNNKHALLSLSSKANTFALLYDKTIHLNWKDNITKTNLTISEGVWTYIAFTWRSNDGRVNIITSSKNASQNEDTFGIHIGRNVLPENLVLGRYMNNNQIMDGYNLRGVLDELRVWQYAKNTRHVLELRDKKFDDYHDGLLLSLPLDEGHGSVAVAMMYNPVNVSVGIQEEQLPTQLGKEVKFISHPENVQSVWMASGLEITPGTNYSVVFRNESLRAVAEEICHKWFYTGNVQGLCSSVLVAQARFYYEACVADVADAGNLAHHKLSVSLFGLYCQKVLDIKECLLHGTFDGFPPCKKTKKKTEIPVVVIVTSVIGVLFVILLCILIIVFIFFKRRRRNRKTEMPQEPEGLRRFAYEMQPLDHGSNTDGETTAGSASASSDRPKKTKKKTSRETKQAGLLMYGFVDSDSDYELARKEGTQDTPKKTKSISFSGETPKRSSTSEEPPTTNKELSMKSDQPGPSTSLLMYGSESDSDDANTPAPKTTKQQPLMKEKHTIGGDAYDDATSGSQYNPSYTRSSSNSEDTEKTHQKRGFSESSI